MHKTSLSLELIMLSSESRASSNWNTSLSRIFIIEVRFVPFQTYILFTVTIVLSLLIVSLHGKNQAL